MRDLAIHDPDAFALLEQSAANHHAQLEAVDRPAPLRMEMSVTLKREPRRA